MATRDLNDKYEQARDNIAAGNEATRTITDEYSCSLSPLEEQSFSQKQLNCIGDSGLACEEHHHHHAQPHDTDEDNSIIDLYYCFDLASAYLFQCCSCFNK